MPQSRCACAVAVLPYSGKRALNRFVTRRSLGPKKRVCEHVCGYLWITICCVMFSCFFCVLVCVVFVEFQVREESLVFAKQLWKNTKSPFTQPQTKPQRKAKTRSTPFPHKPSQPTPAKPCRDQSSHRTLLIRFKLI